MSSKIADITKLTIRLLLGALFIVAAVLKIISIDNFEIYIFSFNIFSFVTTAFLARLIIAAELFLGLCLIFKVYFKQIWWLTMLMMLGFSLFLIYAMIFRNDSNCHCFGSLVELDPKMSFVKNIITIALLLTIKKEESHIYKPILRKWIFGIVIAISLIASFFIVPMDAIYNKIYSERQDVNTVAFQNSLNDSTYINYLKVLPEKSGDSVVFTREKQLLDLNHGRHLINYALSGCKFCKTGAEKITLMFDRHGISHDKLVFVLVGGDVSASKFIKETNTFDYKHWRIPIPIMMDITFGSFPLYIFVEDGKIVKSGDFRIIDEKELTDFFQKND